MSLILGLVLILISSHINDSECAGFRKGGHNSRMFPFGHKKSHKPRNPTTPIINPGNNPSPTGPIINPGPNPIPVGPSPDPLGLQVGFYKGRCPKNTVEVEALITTKVQQQFQKDPTILPALLRMQFHDCFVHGCDASILIAGTSSERSAGPNLTVRGYEFIDALKAALEAVCPRVVSCADIIAIATKVVIKLGGGPDYVVETGRRDGLQSNANDVNLPSPSISVSQSISVFNAKNFTPEEMVLLLGCHSVGISHCAFFENRLYNGTTSFDPNMDSNLRSQLILTCPKGKNSNNVAFLDQNPQSSNKFDNSFFDQIKRNRGILPIDQALARDPKTNAIVQQLALNANLFNTKFANAMIKLQAVDVLTGNQGQIRKVCSKFN